MDFHPLRQLRLLLPLRLLRLLRRFHQLRHLLGLSGLLLQLGPWHQLHQLDLEGLLHPWLLQWF
jgi:hypothetical protein